MAKKLNLTYRLQVASTDVGLDVIPVSGNFGPIPPQPLNLVVKPPFTLEFDINQANQGPVNRANFTIYNLNPQTRDQMRKDQTEPDKYKAIEFWGGYGKPFLDSSLTSLSEITSQSDPIQRVFRGNVTRGYSKRVGVNWQTIIEASDGGLGFINGRVRKTYPIGTSHREIIRDMILSMPGISVGEIGNFPGTLARDCTFEGTPSDLITSFKADDNSVGEFFIDGEKGYYIKTNEYTPFQAYPEITGETILGVPIKEQTLVFVDMIFEPFLVIGQGVNLKTDTVKSLNGFYKVTGLRHRGTISETAPSRVVTTATLTGDGTLEQLISIINK